MRKNYFLNKIASGIFLLISASGIAQNYENGVFVLNEGNAGTNGASVSFLANGATSAVNNVFAAANPGNTNLGNVGQSMAFEGQYAYIMLNMSNTVKVVNRYTFELVATISEGIENPRYMAFHNGKGYVTNWGNAGDTTDDYLAIIDPATNTVTGTIALDNGVERILAFNDKLYVAHQGGYLFGTTVSVVDPVAEEVESVITVGDVPNGLAIKDGSLYVLCGGLPDWTSMMTDGSLYQIDLSDNSATLLTSFAGLNTGNLQLDNDGNFYYTANAAIYKGQLSNPDASEVIATLPPQNEYGIYGMNLIDGKLYVGDAMDYVSPGIVSVFDTDGALQNTYTVGALPNSFYKAETELSTPDLFASTLVLYPNPTSDRFYLNTTDAAKVTISDISGRQVLSQIYSASGITVSQLPAGIYGVEIETTTGKSAKKLIVK